MIKSEEQALRQLIANAKQLKEEAKAQKNKEDCELLTKYLAYLGIDFEEPLEEALAIIGHFRFSPPRHYLDDYDGICVSICNVRYPGDVEIVIDEKSLTLVELSFVPLYIDLDGDQQAQRDAFAQVLLTYQEAMEEQGHDQ